MNRLPKKAAATLRHMHPPQGPRAKWKTVAITAKDPEDFARDLERNLNALTSDGWNITGMMDRGSALIISAQKSEIPKEILDALAGLSPGQRKLPFSPRESNTTEEVIYSYLDEKDHKSLQCESLEQAKMYMEEHVRDESVLPISITVLAVTTYEPQDLLRS